MKIGMKVIIAAAAVLMTFVGFNMLASPSALDIIRSGRTAGMEIVVTAQAPTAGSPAHIS